MVESQECGRIESQPADWIVSCSISGCIKRPRLWTYKKVMDASSSCLDRAELTSAKGRKGKKKKRKMDCDLLTRLVKAERRMNATRLSRLTDVLLPLFLPLCDFSCSLKKEKSHFSVISHQTHFIPRLKFAIYSSSPR